MVIALITVGVSRHDGCRDVHSNFCGRDGFNRHSLSTQHNNGDRGRRDMMDNHVRKSRNMRRRRSFRRSVSRPGRYDA